MARPEQHNCLFCGAFFRADPRNAYSGPRIQDSGLSCTLS